MKKKSRKKQAKKGFSDIELFMARVTSELDQLSSAILLLGNKIDSYQNFFAMAEEFRRFLKNSKENKRCVITDDLEAYEGVEFVREAELNLEKKEQK